MVWARRTANQVGGVSMDDTAGAPGVGNRSCRLRRRRCVLSLGWAAALVLVSCAGSRSAFREAQQEGTVAAYEAFLLRHPGGPEAELAREKLEALLFAEAVELNTVAGFQEFLGEHPGGQRADEALAHLERLEFDAACELHTAAAYEQFLAQHPSGEPAAAARERLEELRFEAAVQSGRVADLSEFLRRHPDGAYAGEARATIAKLDFEEASRENTIPAYQAFLSRHGDEADAARARDRILILERKAELETELAAFRAAQRQDTLDSYQSFLRQYGSGTSASQARTRIRELEREAERRAREAPGRAQAVFVNDGKLVLVLDDGQLLVSEVEGESPSLANDGTRVVFSGLSLTDRVISSSPQYSQYGTTSYDDGIFLWNLATGERTRVSIHGSNPILSPSNEQLAYTYKDYVYTLRLAGEQRERVARGSSPVWLGDSQLLYFDDARLEVVLHDLGEGSVRRLTRPGTRSFAVAYQDPQRWVADVFRGEYVGKRMSAQFRPRPIDAERAGFLEIELVLREDIVLEAECVLRVITHERESRTYLVYESRQEGLELMQGLDFPTGFDVDSRLAKIAYSKDDPLSELPSGVDQAAVFVADLTRSGRHRRVSDVRGVRGLLFLDDGSLLVAALDYEKVRIPLGGGALYQVGTRSLTVPQLEMMKLDPALVHADSIWRVDLDRGRQTLFSGGHGLAGR